MNFLCCIKEEMNNSFDLAAFVRYLLVSVVSIRFTEIRIDNFQYDMTQKIKIFLGELFVRSFAKFFCVNEFFKYFFFRCSTSKFHVWQFLSCQF